MGPTAKPTERSATFRLGLLNKVENGLLLSEGLSSRIIANSNQRVRYGDGSVSVNTFHTQPGGGDCFEDISPNNQDGWILLSGSDQTEGGVGAITFNAQGLAIKYEMIFEGSSNNALGGKTIGEFWVTGEKDAETLNGMVYQIDPFGRYEPTIIEAFTEEGGAWQG